MARPVVVDTDLGYNSIMKEIESMSETFLLIGIQESAKTTSQSKNGRRQKPGDSVATYAAKNEFGTREIPQRSFMRTAFDENINSIENAVEIQYGKVIDGTISLNEALGVLGLGISDLIKKKIRSIHFPPNSKSTIERKGSSKPLIDFGQMIASVTWAIRTRK